MFSKFKGELENKHGLLQTPTGFYCVVAGQFLQLHKEGPSHRVRIGFFHVDDTLRGRFEVLKKRLRISKITYSEKWVRAEFRDLLPARRFQKIDSLLSLLISITGNKSSDNRCSCIQCGNTENIKVFRHDVSLMPLCERCSEEISKSLKDDQQRFIDSPNRYFQALSGVVSVLAVLSFSLVWLSTYLGDATLVLSVALPIIASHIYRQLRGKPGRFAGLALTLLSMTSIAATMHLAAREYARQPALYNLSPLGTRNLQFLSQDDPLVYFFIAVALLLIIWIFGPLLSTSPKFFSLENVDSERRRET